MKAILTTGYLLLACVSQSWGQSQCLSLVWSDEFDYTGKPNPELWDYDLGGNGWGNNELQYYTDSESNASVADGVLTITARKETLEESGYTSARLVSREKGDWLYGRFEIRAKLPTGRGTWPAIWMLPTDWEYGGWPESGEIDIMEHVGYDQGKIHGTVHTQAYHHSIGTQVGGSTSLADASTAFKTYAIEWTEDRIDWFVDDRLYFTFQNQGATFAEWPFDKRFHLLLNIAIGGSWGGVEGVDDSIFPQTMEVDFVRVYKLEETLEISGGAYSKLGEQGVTYSATEFEGDVTYTWSVPADAAIASGQGTKDITVDWGATPGSVSVSIDGDITCPEEAVSLEVDFVADPEGDPYQPFDFSAGVSQDWGIIPGIVNDITLTEESDGSVRVDYRVENADLNPQIFIPFELPLDLSEHQKMSVSMKGTGEAQSLGIQLQDVFGARTSGAPFRARLPADDAFADYAYIYANRWVSSTGSTAVDSS
ncbi:MAG TPA: glycoside hydrolase family 1, partial [Cytophagales bacterium]|nr:glycoside hydrolase family 1 [Cytophagales bacterium]